ncbi:hypothetical protein D9611_009865 [Ephemerocybe angulata]|uniref:NACHT domain-containing protein n=1 Tax=Ephemerocybe angulata TaxID=980116 RepID=A0A8H5FJF0_9AGAR|nr:hypothetical protein D9611_009865 [Tulosesus angulatus]
MSNARRDARMLRRYTQEGSSSNHPAAPGTAHYYNGPVTQYNVEHATNGLFGDNRGNLSQHAPGGHNERKAIDEGEALRYLMQNIAPGAIHDSNERCDAPKCMEETRVAVQEDIMSWIDSGDQDAQSKKIMWVTGPAGTGKTAILGTIADTCKEKGTLAASFFFSAFSGSANRRTKRYFVPTLAFQIMGQGGVEGTREHVLSSVARDQGIIFTKNLKEQFIAMVLNPLLSTAQGAGSGAKAAPGVIIIDGLDECDIAQRDPADSPQARAQVPIRRKEDDQREILSILLLAATNPSFPFRILIASRPEVAIRDFFDTDGKACTRELFLDAKYDPDADIALFYDAKFSTICRRLGIRPEEWPGKEAKLILVRNASGQFIYAATVIRYIEGSPHSPNLQSQSSDKPSMPHQRLQHILGQQQAGSPNNPLEALDVLYRLLLETCPDPELSMKWLRAAQLGDIYTGNPFPVWLLRLVLEASPGEEQYALGPLSSLLPTQISKESLRKPYSFYHKSFLDFLADPTRCGRRLLAYGDALTWVAQRFFQTLDKHVEGVARHRGQQPYIDMLMNLETELQRSSFQTVVPYILSSDLQKWAAAWAERHQNPDLNARENPRQIILSMLDVLHRWCSRYRCHSSCRLSTKKVTDLLTAKGWKVPSFTQVLWRDSMSEGRLKAGKLRQDTQDASSSNHPATPLIVHNYHGPVNQNNVGQASNAIFGDNRGNLSQYAPGGQNERKVVDEAKALDYLIANMAPGAIHNSDERCEAPKCLKDTRVAVQEDIMSWIEAGDQDAQPTRIMWVTGPAGTGKTAILGTIADACKEKGTLAASFFFSAFAGSANRRTKRCLVPTLAYQLMNHGSIPGLREHILSSLVQDPLVFKKDMKEQLNALVLKGLYRVTHDLIGDDDGVPRVIVIDGLDECDVEQYQESSNKSNPSAHVPTRRKEDDQLEVLSLLLLATRHPSFPFRILIASRPEVTIRDFFATDGKACTRELFLDEKYSPDADIALFYDAKFSTICRRFGVKPKDWPGKHVKLILVRNASGQFVYAATAMRYIEGSPHSTGGHEQEIAGQPSTPHRRLEHILGLTPSHSHDGKSSHNPLEDLDALYRLLLETCPDPKLSMKWLRATQIPRESPVWLLRLVLQGSPSEEQYALGPLSSLLLTQISEENLGRPYSFYHKSFLDFIEDPTRCGERFLTEDEVFKWMAQRFFQTLDKHVEGVARQSDQRPYLRLLQELDRAPKSFFQTVAPYILSSDLQKWAAALAEWHQNPDVNDRDYPWRVIFWMLNVLHRGCWRYLCRSSCRLSTKKVTGVLKAKGWKVPNFTGVLKREWEGGPRYKDLRAPSNDQSNTDSSPI